MADKVPALIQQLAASEGGKALSWKEYDDHIVIVLVDGRKLTFPRTPAGSRPAAGEAAKGQVK